jgi:hypothetical protein
MLTLKNVHFVKLSKYGTDFTIAFLSSRRSKTYMEHLIRSSDEGVMPLERCSLSGLPTVETADPSQDFRPMLGLPTRFGTSGRPNKKGCSDLAFWIPMRTVLN